MHVDKRLKSGLENRLGLTMQGCHSLLYLTEQRGSMFVMHVGIPLEYPYPASPGVPRSATFLVSVSFDWQLASSSSLQKQTAVEKIYQKRKEG